jgi:hypothetical protein
MVLWVREDDGGTTRGFWIEACGSALPRFGSRELGFSPQRAAQEMKYDSREKACVQYDDYTVTTRESTFIMEGNFESVILTHNSFCQIEHALAARC